jgi:CRP-like cAMP-binding protein
LQNLRVGFASVDGTASARVLVRTVDRWTGRRLFADLDEAEADKVAALFKERRFPAGETVIKEGSGGAAFYVIKSGEAKVTIGGELRAVLKSGDHFGEIALIDEGARMATITAATELVCHGLTLWEFRPLVQENGAIGWKLMQSLARELRAAEQALAKVRAESVHSAAARK